MVHVKTIRKELEAKLEAYSIEEIQKECKSVLKTLREFPKENKWQIRYYEKFWLLLSEYN